MTTRSRISCVTICLALVILAGCSVTPQAKFYTLTPMAPQQGEKPAATAKKVTVNIAPVEIPDYLNRQQIVTRDGRNELKLAEFDRWGGSLTENMATVLAENLSQLLASEQVFAHPRGQSASPDYTVALRVLQLDCVPGESVRLKAQWTVLSGAERKETVTRMTDITEKLSDKKYETVVAAVSLALEKLSGEIAREIKAKPGEKI